MYGSPYDERDVNGRGPLLPFLLGGVVGGALGAACALLFAPASGRKSRARIRQTANRLTHKADEWKDRAVETIGERKQMAVSTMLDVLDRAAGDLNGAHGPANARSRMSREHV